MGIVACTPIHPGEILADELAETGLSVERLGQYFGTAADFWMNLQRGYELDLARQRRSFEVGSAMRNRLD